MNILITGIVIYIMIVVVVLNWCLKERRRYGYGRRFLL